MNKPTFYVTTPIYYVNDVPHIGHAYTNIAADVLARFYRLAGVKVMFLTGTDEHGQKIETSAQAADMSPQSFVDKISKHLCDLEKILFAAGIEPPNRIFAHGWWTVESQKISKSLGNTIDPFALVNEFGIDQVRYFLMREIPFGNDGDFSREAFVHRVNSDLANDFGNLAQRVLSFVQKNAEAQVPVAGSLMAADKAILTKAQQLPDLVYEAANMQAIHKMCELIWAVVADANRYIDAEEPWALRKTDPQRMSTVLHTLMNVIRYVAIMASPVIPDASTKALDQLAVPLDRRDIASLSSWNFEAGTHLPAPTPIFPRLDLPAK